MSAEEKKQTIMKIFADSNEFYQLKDILKIGSKKGIVENTIKPILETLVMDSLIVQEKIGTSQYFYLPFKSSLDPIESEQNLQKTEQKLKELEQELAIEEEKIVDQELSKEYEQLVKDNNMLKTRLNQVEKQFETLKYNDDIKVFQKMIELYANSIDDFCAYIGNAFGVNREEIIKNFGIPQEW
jgi:DNA-binding transcriptional MerR regulator